VLTFLSGKAVVVTGRPLISCFDFSLRRVLQPSGESGSVAPFDSPADNLRGCEAALRLGGASLMRHRSMIRSMARFVPLWYTVMRIVLGVLFFLHGTQKLFGFPPYASGPAQSVAVMSLPWVAGMIETSTGALIAMGVWSGPAALLASGEMAFAYFLSHAPRSPWPTNNVGEAAIFNCCFFCMLPRRVRACSALTRFCGARANGTSVPDRRPRAADGNLSLIRSSSASVPL